LTPAGGEAYALRWKSLSTDPLQTLHLHLSADLFVRTVQQVVDRDPMRVMVQERTGFHDPLLAHLGLSLQQELQHSAPDATFLITQSAGEPFVKTQKPTELRATFLLRADQAKEPSLAHSGKSVHDDR